MSFRGHFRSHNLNNILYLFQQCSHLNPNSGILDVIHIFGAFLGGAEGFSFWYLQILAVHSYSEVRISCEILRKLLYKLVRLVLKSEILGGLGTTSLLFKLFQVRCAPIAVRNPRKYPFCRQRHVHLLYLFVHFAWGAAGLTLFIF